MIGEILQILQEINPFDEVNEDTALLESFLDSMGLLLLINELEDKYLVEIPLDKLELEHFENIKNIVKFINGLKKDL